MNFKEDVYQSFQQLLAEKVNHLQQLLQELHLSAANETKSTAGDKHETALAMLQLEQENKRKQLKDLQLQQAVLHKIDPTLGAPEILNGALVQTDKGYFFMSVALGKAVINGITVYALSPQSPLGAVLRGKLAGDVVELNGNSYKILAVE